jgi:flagellar hook-associated protein 3 FlgL
MRVSTSMLFDGGVNTMQKRTSEMLKLQQQLSTQRRILTPSDDPVAAAQALQVTQANNLNQLYMQNQTNASDTMALGESQLNEAGTLLQSMYTRIIQLGDGALAQQDRNNIATDLREGFKQLMSIGNQTDGLGNYIFAGYRGDTIPFVGDVDNGVTYQGDAGHNELQVSASRSLQVSESGLDVFMRVPNTSVPFKATAATANSGTALIGRPAVTDATQWSTVNPQVFTVTFAAGATANDFDYTIRDYQNNVVGLSPAGTYTVPLDANNNPTLEAVKIPLPGLGAEFEIRGMPDAGDVVNIDPAGTIDVFTMLANAVKLAENPIPNSNPALRAQYDELLSYAITNSQSSHDNILTYRAAFGSRMQEAETLQSAGSARSLEYTATLSRLQDIDLTKTISDLAQTETTLKAAQLSFNKVTQLSLFNYL